MLKIRINRLAKPLSGLILILFLFTASAAADIKQIVSDYGPLTATLVMPTGANWIIDKDASHGVKIGDLFTVSGQAKSVVHPVTQKVLGKIDTVQGYLQVIRTDEGFSIVSVVGKPGTLLQKGAEAIRYKHVPASFWDKTGKAEPLYLNLQKKLPHLQWAPYNAVPPQQASALQTQPDHPQLFFIISDQSIVVKDHNRQSIGIYPSSKHSKQSEIAKKSSGIVAPAGPAATGTATGTLGRLSQTLFGKSDSTDAGQTGPESKGSGIVVSARQDQEGIWFGPHLNGRPVGMTVADVTGNGRQEIAALFVDRLVLSYVANGRFQTLATHSLGTAIKPLSIDSFDLDGDGKAELYLSAIQSLSASGSVFQWQENQLRETREAIPWFFRRITLPDGSSRLLGQALDPSATDNASDFRGTVFTIVFSKQGLKKSTEMELPHFFEINGFLPIQADGRKLYINLSLTDNLQVVEPKGDVLWESDKPYGGSNNFMKRKDQLRDSFRYRHLKQRVEAGPGKTVLVPLNQGSRLTSLWRKYSPSRLVAMTFNGYSLVERWHTKPQNGYLADYQFADADNDGQKEIVMLVQFNQGGWLSNDTASSAILIYEL